MMNRTVIGLSGVAGAGKDLFFQLLSKELPVRRFALADALKRETSAWTTKQYGIDAVNCSREEKELIRPFLVSHGIQKRKQSKGRHWIDALDKEIKGFLLNAQTDDIPVITDIRYQEFEKDEVHWLTQELGGVLVHVSQFTTSRLAGSRSPFKVPTQKYKQPANEEEKRMDPILKSLAKYRVDWPTVDEELHKSAVLYRHVNDFVKWYEKHK
jgi:hypothetical protein